MDSKKDLFKLIRDKQPKMSVVNIKRELTRKFGVKKFDDLPEEKYAEALEHARKITDFYISHWETSRLMAIVIKNLLHDIESPTRELFDRVGKKLRSIIPDTEWAKMDEIEAYIKAKSLIGNQNIWEFAFSPVEGRVCGE